MNPSRPNDTKMSSDFDNATPVDIFVAIRQACEQLEDAENLVSADEQISFVLGQGWHKQFGSFEDWCKQQVMPVLTASKVKHSSKDFANAKYHKEMADMYMVMIEIHFQDKAFECLSQAIFRAPFSEVDFLFDCFIARSGLHHQLKNYDAALADIDRALHFKGSSLSAIQRKVALLKRLDRGPEAYAFIAGILKKSDNALKGTDLEALQGMKKDMKRFKRSALAKINDADISAEHCLEVDSRLEWAFNENTNRHLLKAAKSISSGEVLLREDPALFVVRAESMLTHCNNCFTECRFSSWPCSTCTEVIFCSERCAKRASREFHHLECGVLNAMTQQSTNTSRMLQVYRHLARLGHQKLLKLNEEVKIVSAHYPDFGELVGCEKVSHQRMVSLFARSAAAMHQQIKSRQPLRSASELANAIFLCVIYSYKANLKQMPADEMHRLIAILATELMRVNLVEYGWYGTNGNDLKVHIGNYQCLLGSQVGHSCIPNVEWKFDEKQFSLKATRKIKPGEEISISFGPTSSQPFFSRLSQLLHFTRLCNCSLCLDDASRHFALRCTLCNGPIPFAPEENFIELRCLYCERTFQPGLAYAKMIFADFKSMQQSLWILPGVKSVAKSSDALQHIEKRLYILALAMPTGNKQLLSVVGQLTSEYIVREMYHLAVEWYQWFAQVNIPLGTDDSQGNLAKLHNLTKWAAVYFNILPSLTEKDEKFGSYSAVCKGILKKMSKTIDELAESDEKLLNDTEQFNDILKVLRQQANDKWAQFEKIVSTFKSGQLLEG